MTFELDLGNLIVRRKEKSMFNFLVTAEGGLTTAGYAVSVIAVLILIILVAVLLQKNTSALKFTTQQLVTCAVALALAYVTSYIKIFKLPFGGSVTLFSMLFIVLIGYWYGIKVGILTGLVYGIFQCPQRRSPCGIFQFLQEPYVLSFFQVCCDYILAFGAMGLSGLFTKSRKHGLLKAYILAILARGAFHALGGYLYWMDYMPDNFPKSLTALYPIIYNYSYILLEGVLTIVVISIPAVSRALGRMRIMATGGNRQSAATEK